MTNEAQPTPQWTHISEGKYGRVYIKAPDGREFDLGTEPDFKNLAAELTRLYARLEAADALVEALVEIRRHIHEEPSTVESVDAIAWEAVTAYRRTEGGKG